MRTVAPDHEKFLDCPALPLLENPFDGKQALLDERLGLAGNVGVVSANQLCHAAERRVVHLVLARLVLPHEKRVVHQLVERLPRNDLADDGGAPRPVDRHGGHLCSVRHDQCVRLVLVLSLLVHVDRLVLLLPGLGHPLGHLLGADGGGGRLESPLPDASHDPDAPPPADLGDELVVSAQDLVCPDGLSGVLPLLGLSLPGLDGLGPPLDKDLLALVRLSPACGL